MPTIEMIPMAIPMPTSMLESPEGNKFENCITVLEKGINIMIQPLETLYNWI